MNYFSEIKIPSAALYEVVSAWWDRWHRFVEYETENDMWAQIPDHIKVIVKRLEEADATKAKFDYEAGLWKTKS